MLAPYIDALSELRQVRSDLDSFVLKFDLEELTVIYHPANQKVICIFRDTSFNDCYNVFNFYVELAENIERVNLTLSICFSSESNNFVIRDMFFPGIEYKLYRIRAN